MNRSKTFGDEKKTVDSLMDIKRRILVKTRMYCAEFKSEPLVLSDLDELTRFVSPQHNWNSTGASDVQQGFVVLIPDHRIIVISLTTESTDKYVKTIESDLVTLLNLNVDGGTPVFRINHTKNIIAELSLSEFWEFDLSRLRLTLNQDVFTRLKEKLNIETASRVRADSINESQIAADKVRLNRLKSRVNEERRLQEDVAKLIGAVKSKPKHFGDSEIIVDSVPSFIKAVDHGIECLKDRINNDVIVAFRGETKKFPINGVPNLLRDGTKANESFKTNPEFERGVIDEVRAHDFSHADSYLLNAINSQHGGFPSRLLDITFNSLTALFFATTPHYTKDLKTDDLDDGIVIIYAIDRLFSPYNPAIQKQFNQLINRETGTRPLDGYRHFAIDFAAINQRIIAQQGGFIMFDGNQMQPIPRFRQYVIRIRYTGKPRIREQLRKFFGISMGTIYPESNNMVEPLIDRAQKLTGRLTDYRTLLDDLKSETEYYLKMLKEHAEEQKVSGSEAIQSIPELDEQVSQLEENLMHFYAAYCDSLLAKLNTMADFDKKLKYRVQFENFQRALTDRVNAINRFSEEKKIQSPVGLFPGIEDEINAKFK